jgi:hypothetical protein
MLVDSPVEARKTTSAFPSEEVSRRLETAIRAAADDDLILEGSWEPRLDSLSMVSVLITLEDLFEFPLPPERLVRRGGYSSMEEGLGDMYKRCQGLWNERCGSEVQT